MYTSSGTLRYSPKREASDQNWWLILDCDPALGEYYRHLYHHSNHRCRKLARPFWGPHITVVRNEEPAEEFKQFWKLHAGEKIEFQYHGGVKDNYSPDRYRSFYWVDVVCPRFAEIRQELGLADVSTAWTRGGLHLTIGSWENPARKDWYEANFKRR
jgi:hypothetical protein